MSCNKSTLTCMDMYKSLHRKGSQARLDETFRYFQFVTLSMIVAEIRIEYFQFGYILLGLEGKYFHIKSVEMHEYFIAVCHLKG